MISIEYTRSNGRMEIRIIGHADSRVCAGVSAITWTIDEYVLEEGKVKVNLLKAGDTTIVAEMSTESLNVVDRMCNGYALIAETHPDHCSYTKTII